MSARHPGSPGHPRKRDQLRVFLARTGFPKLIAAFLAAMLLTAAVLALGYRLTRESGEPASS